MANSYPGITASTRAVQTDKLHQEAHFVDGLRQSIAQNDLKKLLFLIAREFGLSRSPTRLRSRSIFQEAVLNTGRRVT